MPSASTDHRLNGRSHFRRVLESHLRKYRTHEVTVAGGGLPPPPMAFQVRFPRLSITVAGTDENEFVVKGRKSLLQTRPGHVVFIPANFWNRPTWDQKGKVLHLLFGKLHMGLSLVRQDGFSTEPPATDKVGIHCAISDPIHQMLSAFSHLSPGQQQSEPGRLLIEAILHTCLHLLREPEAPQGRKGRDTYDRICLHLQEHFHLPISRESVAKHFRINPSHVSRLFQNEGDMGFSEFLTSARIQRAKHLLKHHHLTVDEIAVSCGFTDSAYFCRVFKHNVQLTPSAYRHTSPHEEMVQK